MEKILTPFEKECMMKCLENIQGLRIEFYNAFNKWWIIIKIIGLQNMILKVSKKIS